MPTSSETLKKLGERGYKVTLLKHYIDWAQTGAGLCDIKGVIWRMIELDSHLGELAREAMRKPRWDSTTPLTEDLVLLANIENEAVAEVLATLKAKQCKCG